MSHRDTSGCPPHELHNQVDFASGQPHEGSPETEFRQTPDVSVLAKFFNDTLTFPDGLETEIWGFEDETSGRGLPSPPIRAREGDIVHVELKPSKRVHTIHMHGVEPDSRNDGVGHTSFEVTGSYTYQFEVERGETGNPNRGSAGNYFYHCHVNTVLHVEMGMFGPMVFDPPTGRGKAFFDDPVGYDTRAETLLVPFSVDPRWHELGHAAGLDGEDVGLNRFEPTHFYALGANLNDPWPVEPAVKVVTRILATAPPDKPALLRFLNGNYFPFSARFLGGLRAEVISHDGRALRDTSKASSPPLAVDTDFLAFGAAERYDLRLRPPAGARPGDTFAVQIQWKHWITGDVINTQEIPVVVIEHGPAGSTSNDSAGTPAGEEARTNPEPLAAQSPPQAEAPSPPPGVSGAQMPGPAAAPIPKPASPLAPKRRRRRLLKKKKKVRKRRRKPALKRPRRKR